MTREEAIKELQSYAEASWGGLNNAFNLALTALRGPTREMVERMRGEWKPYGFDKRGRGGIWHCTQCGKSYPVQNTFCPHCGSPMTDEAVDMMLEKWREALENA